MLLMRRIYHQIRPPHRLEDGKSDRGVRSLAVLFGLESGQQNEMTCRTERGPLLNPMEPVASPEENPDPVAALTLLLPRFCQKDDGWLSGAVSSRYLKLPQSELASSAQVSAGQEPWLRTILPADLRRDVCRLLLNRDFQVLRHGYENETRQTD